MRGDTFISLSFLDLIFSADFLSKRSKRFGGKNWHQSGYFDTLPRLLSLLKVAPRCSLLSAFNMNCSSQDLQNLSIMTELQDLVSFRGIIGLWFKTCCTCCINLKSLSGLYKFIISDLFKFLKHHNPRNIASV